MRSQFAGGRQQLPFSNNDIVVGSGGTTTSAYTYYFALQGQNPVGLNLPTIIGPIAINAGQKATITIPSAARKNGEWWQAFVISASTSNDPNTFTQIAKVDNYTVGGDLIALPAAIALTSDEHFALSAIVADTGNFPSTPVNGMCRQVTNLDDYVYEYSQSSSAAVDNSTVLSASVGRWLKIDSFSTAIADTSAAGGCTQDIADIEESTVRTPNYACDGSSGQPLRFWLNNDGISYEPRGKRVGLTVELDGEVKSQAFNGLLKVIFRGFANTTTGELRTTDDEEVLLEGIDEERTFQARKSNLVLEDDLQPGEAYVLDVYPDFAASDLGGQIAKNSVIKIYPFLFNQSGDYVEAGVLFGNVIYPSGDRLLVVPSSGLSCKVLGGSGMVDSYSFTVGATIIGSLVANTANQKISINGNGAVKIALSPLPSTEAIRAIISTIDGVGSASDFSASASVAAGSYLSVEVEYPVAVRLDYPDQRVAGNAKGSLNASSVTLYVKRLSDNQIRAFANNSVIAGTEQTFTINSWSAGSVIASIPEPSDLSFGLYVPVGCEAIALSGASDFTAGDYQVSAAFVYTNTVTSVSHDESLGCIIAATSTVADLNLGGTKWYTVIGQPAGSLGNIDDFALDTASGKVWKKNGGNTWIIVAGFSSNGVNSQGIWDIATAYSAGDLVQYRNSLWLAIANSTGINPDTDGGTNWELLIRGVYNAGAYNSSTPYRLNNLVSSDGKTYLYINSNASTGSVLSDTAYWLVLGCAISNDSVTDLKIGDRTAADSVAPTNLGPMKLTNWLGAIVNRIKAVLGTSNWYDAPPITLQNAYSHAISTSNPHSVTVTQIGAIATSQRGVANGIASLGSDGLVPSSQLPASSGGGAVVDATFTTKGIIQLAGDIAGSATSVTVAKIQGRSVSTAAPNDGQLLSWDAAASAWKPATVTTLGGTAFDVNSVLTLNGEILTYNGNILTKG